MHRCSVLRLVILASVAMIAAPRVSIAQQTAPGTTFKSGITLVDVDARVLDRQGRFVADLTKNDFQVFEDGKERPLTRFSVVNIPIPTSNAREAVLSRIRSNAADVGRLYVILIDDANIHPIRAGAARSIARQFIEQRLGPNDQAAITVTSGGRGYQDLTTSRHALLAAIDRVIGRGLASGAQDPFAAGSTEGRTRGAPRNDSDAGTRVSNARMMLRAVRGIAKAMPTLDSRRKALIVISEGFTIEPNAFDRTLEDDTIDTIAAAVKSNVAIYPIDPRGLLTGKAGTFTPISLPDEEIFSPTQRVAHQRLYALAAETGGFALYNANDPAPAFTRVVDDSSHYYMLVYEGAPPTGKKREYRRIEVRVTRPDVSVASRAGYFVAP